ncbi:hypothetical protein [Anaerotignum sp. MB30-C6]|uniref:hypothetical protein n=1 Tax=Anaerotignum sp. MB30-C6 TaxID=3070814 RepID=UPI0027DCFA47|nr:hypothetical protein [Anaerotignum sp. MB30-C6]WMI80908.1 hypothetical protein RBQ60_13975 [Anaerotignum sp. MB30-C6]
MKIRCLVGCNGVGYEKFEVDEIRDIPKETAEKLVDFGYAEKLSTRKGSGKKDGADGEAEPDATGEVDGADGADGEAEPKE